MKRLVTYGFKDDFLGRLADECEHFGREPGGDLRRLAVVFGGHRPALFLKRELARRSEKSFFPPRFFTIDEFVEYVLRKRQVFLRLSDLDAQYLLFRNVRTRCPQILKKRRSFAEFLPWAREILAFIEELDLEDVPSELLRNVQFNAEIGYAIPPDVNRLLENIIDLREAFHEELRQSGRSTRGYAYLTGSRAVTAADFPEFDQIYFAHFFALHATEKKLMKALFDAGKAALFFQGDEDRWPALKKNARDFGVPITAPDDSRESSGENDPRIELYSGFDTHSQVGLVREILKKMLAEGERLERTVIVLADNTHVIPLLSEVSGLIEEFNVSLGYPLKRSSFHSLLQFVFSAQLSRKGGSYYAKDYLKLLRHPFVKNLRFSKSPTVTRVLVHKIEEVLTGAVKTPLGGQLFVELKELEKLEDLYDLTVGVLRGMELSVRREDLREILQEIHARLLTAWESIASLSDFAGALGDFLDLFLQKSFMGGYPLNLKIAERMMALLEEIRGASFNKESFTPEEMFKICNNRMEHEMVSFLGSPLRGLQILGLLETRALNFENVIVLGLNEGVLPRLRVYDPLIPREVMVSLNLDRLEQEEEIQRYQFLRLIHSARNVHLVYEESAEREKSRFVEELIWGTQKKKGSSQPVPALKAAYTVRVTPKTTDIPKTPEVVEFLKKHRYSASSLNTYLRCPLRFYYKYVLGLEEKEDLLEEPENRQVGTFLHELLQEAFGKFVGKQPKITAAFRKQFFKAFETKFEETFGRSMKSDAFLLKAVLKTRLQQFLDKEKEAEGLRDVKKILEIEQDHAEQVSFSSVTVKLVYKIDRIERLADGTVLLVDFKAGSEDPMPKRLEVIRSMELSRDNIKKQVISFQMPLYFDFLSRRFPGEPLKAAFYNLRTLELKEFPKSENGAEQQGVREAFARPLDFILSEILDPQVHFRPDDREPRYCATCPFYDACR